MLSWLEKVVFLVFPVLLFPLSWVHEKERQNNKVESVIEGGACGVMVIVVGNGNGDTSLNPGPG